jgi:hypothetical protein
MASQRSQICWHFSFGLEKDGEGAVTDTHATEFMDAIVALAEARGLVVGGGYGSFKDGDLAPRLHRAPDEA